MAENVCLCENIFNCHSKFKWTLSLSSTDRPNKTEMIMHFVRDVDGQSQNQWWSWGYETKQANENACSTIKCYLEIGIAVEFATRRNLHFNINMHGGRKKKRAKEYTQECWSRCSKLLFFAHIAIVRARCGWILYAVIVVWVCFAEYSFFSSSKLLFFLLFPTALYFVHHIYTTHLYNIFLQTKR